MKLLNLSLRDFKGIHTLKIDLQGEDANIYGENATGKTTIYDAFLWLMFDKDSTNRKDFAVKPHDPAGKEIHFLQTEVEAALLLESGKKVTLRKVYSEKWTKRRGEADRTFSGHETEYLVDGVPKTKGEYMALVDGMIDEQTFKLITNPAYFNTMLSWQERRQTLFELSKFSISDEDIIESAPEFNGLREAVHGRTIEDARAAAKYALKHTRDEIEKIPVRIDEINHNLTNVYEFSVTEWERTEKLRNGCLEKIAHIDSSLANAQTVAQAHADKLKAVEDIRSKLREMEAQLKEAAGREIIDARNEAENIQLYLFGKSRDVGNLNDEITKLQTDIDIFNEKAPGLRAEFDEIMAQEFIESLETPICSLCGQPLPAEMAAKETGELKRAFYEQREAKAMEISKKGKELKARADRAAEEIESYKKKISEIESEISEKQKRLHAMRKIAQQDIPNIIPIEDKEYACLLAAYKKAEAETKYEGSSGTVEVLLDEKRVLQDSLSGYEKKLASRKQYEDAGKRISELKAQEKDLAAKVIAQEKILNLIEKFISYKSGLLEEKINALFPTARWKLFDVQINGGITDCCECMIGGVPYDDANNAAKINAGLEIIDVISRARGITAPIFIDNRESVNELYEIGAQVISLFVSKDKKLRIETTKKKEEVA